MVISSDLYATHYNNIDEIYVQNSKKCYLVENPPGTIFDIPISGYSLNIEKIQQPELNVVNLGYQNFAYINIEIMNIEWLYLHRNWHRKPLYTIKEKNFMRKHG